MNMKEYIRPVVVLTAICLVISLALAYTNSLTAPIIAEAANAQANAARALVLPDGLAYEKVEAEYDGVTEIYEETSGVGYTITAVASGYNGDIKLMVGFDNSTGQISGVRVLEHGESKGIGTKAVDNQEYLDQYIGQGEAPTVDAISGATYSSKGIRSAVGAACAAYNELRKGA